MDKEIVKGYLQGNHYLRTGVFFIISLLSLLAFLPIGNIRYSFLFCLIALIFLIIEFIYYYRITKEISKDRYVTKRMKVGRMSIINMKNKNVGILFEGIIDNKVYCLKLYQMDIKHKNLMENLKRYTYIDMDFYPLTHIIKDYHPHLGE